MNLLDAFSIDNESCCEHLQNRFNCIILQVFKDYLICEEVRLSSSFL
jgi:hypothetical protein